MSYQRRLRVYLFDKHYVVDHVWYRLTVMLGYSRLFREHLWTLDIEVSTDKTKRFLFVSHKGALTILKWTEKST